MSGKERLYSVHVDGCEITRVTLGVEEYHDQASRNKIRRMISETYQVPMHYLRLHQVQRTRYRWDEETKHNQPIGENKMTYDNYNPFEVAEKNKNMPEFFQGMACAYEDVAHMLENLKANLPEKLKYMDRGMDTMILGVREKITALQSDVMSHMAQAEAEKETSQ